MASAAPAISSAAASGILNKEYLGKVLNSAASIAGEKIFKETKAILHAHQRLDAG